MHTPRKPRRSSADASRFGRMGAYAQQALHDTRETSEPGRTAFLKGFEKRVDPAGALLPAERARRARAALKLHMTRLAMRSAEARRNRATQEGANS